MATKSIFHSLVRYHVCTAAAFPKTYFHEMCWSLLKLISHLSCRRHQRLERLHHWRWNTNQKLPQGRGQRRRQCRGWRRQVRHHHHGWQGGHGENDAFDKEWQTSRGTGLCGTWFEWFLQNFFNRIFEQTINMRKKWHKTHSPLVNGSLITPQNCFKWNRHLSLTSIKAVIKLLL